MVRIIFTPKTVEQQWVRHVQHEPLADKVLFPPGPVPAVYRICLCEDGRRGVDSSKDSIALRLTDLFVNRWRLNTKIEIVPFTFIDNTTAAYETLVNCDMFYFAGVFSQLYQHSKTYRWSKFLGAEFSAMRSATLGFAAEH